MNVFNLFAKINLDTAEYKKNLKEVEDNSKTTAQKLEQDLSKTTDNAKKTFEEISNQYDGITSQNEGWVNSLINSFNTGRMSASDFDNGLKALGLTQKQVKNDAKTFTDQVAELKKKWQQVETQNKTNLALLKTLFNNGVISAKQYNEAVANAKSRQQELLDNAKEIGLELPKDFEKAGKAMSSSAASASVSWAAVAQVIVKIIGLLKQLVTESIEYADNVAQIAKQYGMTTESVSELQYIASQTHTDISNITSAMTQLERKAVNEGEVFQELGISVKTASGDFKSMEDLFFETIGTLSDLSDEEEKSAYMVQLFGRTTMESGELFRLTREEIAGLKTEAHDLGIVMSEQAVTVGEDISKRWEALKLQAQSAIAEMLLGDEGEATEKFDNLLEDLLKILENFAPRILSFALKLFIKVWIEMQKQMPSLISELIQLILDMIFEINWWQVGIDIGKATVEGILNIVISALNKLLGWLGIKIPKVDFGVDAGGNYFSDYDTKNEYEITEHKTEEVTVKIEASGDTAISERSAEETAKALAPYIDEILGAK